jgi:hypothetical protein
MPSNSKLKMRRFASLRGTKQSRQMLAAWIASSFLLAMTRCDIQVWVLFSIDFLQTFLAQAVAVMFLQIGFGAVFKLHFHAPAIDRMHAFEGFSATRTGFCHFFNCFE